MMKWVFGADSAPFTKGLDKMRQEVKGFSNTVKGQLAAALGAGAIIAGFKNLFQEMDRVQKLGLRFGESAETIQKISHAANLAGADMETMAKAMTAVTRNASAAARDGGSMADAFARVGIDASEFVNLSLDQKVLALAAGFESSKGAGDQLSNMMSVLGRSGAELVPLLSQGQEELRKQFAATATVSQGTVDAIANFNDQLTETGKTAQVLLAGVFDVFRLVFGSIGALIGGAAGTAMTTLDMVVDSATAAGQIISRVLTGNFSGAADAAAEFRDKTAASMIAIKDNAVATAETIKDVFNDIYNPEAADKEVGPDLDALQAQAEEALATEKERLKLMEEIARLQEDARQKDLSLAEKILEAEEKRAALIEAMNESSGNDQLQKQKELLELEERLSKLTKERSDAAESASSDELKRLGEELNRIQKAEEADAESLRNRAFENADTEGKVAILSKERDQLLRDALEAEGGGDRATAIEKRTEARERGFEIEDLLKEALPEIKSPSSSIATSSLASIGAGGSANLLTSETIQQRQLSVLEQIAQNTARTETGETKIPEPV
jgi:hypothetical protein